MPIRRRYRGIMIQTEKRKNLIICPVGESISYHRDWVKGKRNFDIITINFSDIPGFGKVGADFYFEVKGFKYEIIKKVIDENVDLVKMYDYVWLPDDDLAISTDEINRLFDIFKEYNLDFGQPAVKNNYCIHNALRRRINCFLRYVNFVELMCPLFSVDSLFTALSTFDFNKSAYGIDWIWSEKLKNKKIAVIDAVSVLHMKRLFSGPLYDKFKEMGVSLREDMEAVKEVYKLHTTFEKYEEYSRIYKPWAEKLGILGKSLISEKLMLAGQKLFYIFYEKLNMVALSLVCL